MRTKLALSPAAQLSIHFCQENQLCCISERDLIEDTPLIERERYRGKREEKKAQHPTEYEPTTSLAQCVCSTTVLQLLSHYENLLHVAHFQMVTTSSRTAAW